MFRPSEAEYPDIHTEVIAIFSDLQLEYAHCSICGDYHPPELHISPAMPSDAGEPEEA